MPSISDDQIRHQILEILRNSARKNPTNAGVSREEMKEMLQISEQIMDFNVFYLEEKGLARLLTVMGTPWISATITAFGTDVIEQKSRYADEFPFIQTNIQQVFGDVSGQITQVAGARVNFTQTVTDSFKTAHDIVESRTDITHELREEIKENLKSLEEELKKKEADAGKVQKLWNWLKRNANWIVPTLVTVVLEGVKRSMSEGS